MNRLGTMLRATCKLAMLLALYLLPFAFAFSFLFYFSRALACSDEEKIEGLIAEALGGAVGGDGLTSQTRRLESGCGVESHSGDRGTTNEKGRDRKGKEGKGESEVETGQRRDGTRC